MDQKNKRKSTDLKTALILLVMVAILLIASTYAWFTANQTVTISSIDVTVEASNGLQISTDGTTWKAVIANTDITTGAYSGNTNQLPSTLSPVSTIGEIDSSTGFMKIFDGTATANETTGDYYLTTSQLTDTAGVTGKYIAFDVFLKVDSDSPLYLTTSSGVSAKLSGAEIDNGLKNAARVAFCKEGNVAVGSTVADMIALKGASEGLIWEPNYDAHTSAAVSHASDTYGITTTAGTGKSIITYYGVKQAIASPGILLSQTMGTDTTNFAQVTPTYTTTTTFGDETSNVALFGTAYTGDTLTTAGLSAGITKVRVYMWVEGQDVDCENNASGSNITYNVQFSLNSTPATT